MDTVVSTPHLTGTSWVCVLCPAGRLRQCEELQSCFLARARISMARLRSYVTGSRKSDIVGQGRWFVH